MRIGEQLVREGTLSLEQIEQGLSSQIVHGGRLGTNLVDLEKIDLDTLAEALGRQHGLPAALQRHFDRSDPAVQARVSSQLADTFCAVPLGLISEDPPRVAVAFLDPPEADAVARLSSALGAEVEAAIAPELRVLYHLERAYGVRRPNRFLRVDTRPDGVAVIDERRRYVTPIGEAATAKHVAIARIAVPHARPPDALYATTLPEALRAIRGATGRDRVANLAVAALDQGLAGQLGAGLLLTVRDGMAFGWRGFAPAAAEADFLESMAVPLDVASLLRGPYRDLAPFAGAPPPEGAELDQRLWARLGCARPAEVVVAPVSLGKRVVCLLYGHAADLGAVPAATASAVDQIAHAAATAFVRLVQAAQR